MDGDDASEGTMRLRVASLWTPGMPSASPGPWVMDISGDVVISLSRDSDRSQVVDFDSTLTAVPGYIDSHEHIGLDVGDEPAQARETAGTMLLRGAMNLRTMVESGITTIRDCGERQDVEPEWIAALGEGHIVGPRVIRSISPISRTGGHGWHISKQVDGVDAIISAVREKQREGADFIKVMVSGGVATVGSDQSRAEYTPEELFALVAEAHRLGMRVAAHGYGGSGVTDALNAGVDTVEHGALVSDEQLRIMRRQGTVLVVTTGIVDAFLTDDRVPPGARAVMARTIDSAKEMLVRARKTGVKIAVGSDCAHGGIGNEIGFLVEAGYTPLEAMVAATAGGSEALARPELGRIEVGAMADMVLLNGDPTVDPELASHPQAVLQGRSWTFCSFGAIQSGAITRV